MAQSANELKIIHTRSLATPGKKYFGDDDKVYIGTKEGRLKQLDDSKTVIFKPTEEIESTNVQSAIEEVEARVTLAEVDIDTLFEDEKLFINTASTGVIEFDGLSIESNTLFGIGAIKAWFIDSTTDVGNPTKTYIEFDATTGNTVPDIATQNVTYVGIDVNGLLTKQGTPFTPTQSRTIIQLGVIVHSDNISINAINNQPEVILNPANQLSDLMSSIGFFNVTGNVISANGVNLNINKSSGYVFKEGVNFVTDPLNPHTLLLAALTAPSNMRYRLLNGTEYPNTAVIDPANWDNAGVLTAMTGTRWQIQRIYVFQSNLIRIQYGQATYTTLTDAIQGISTEAFLTEQNLSENGLLRGLLIVRRSATDLSDPTRALFIEVPRFGGIIGLGSVSTSTLQQVYNNSVAPQIVTTTALGSVQIKRGSAADTDYVFEILNGAGAQTAWIKGNGTSSFGSAEVINKSCTFDGQGGVIAVNSTTSFEVDFTGTIIGWTLLETSNTPISSSIVLDAWKDTYANYPPTVADTIFGTKPALSGAIKNQSGVLAIAVTSGDIIKVNVDSVTSAIKVKLIFHLVRT